jgi:hypothetical protein
MPWPKEDEIRWVEQRILERQFIEREREREEREGIPELYRQHHGKLGDFNLEDYLAWIRHVRDRLSFQAVGEMLFSKDQTPDGRKMKAHRAWARVEWEFGRGPLKRKRKPLGFAIFGPYIVPKRSEQRRARRAHKK